MKNGVYFGTLAKDHFGSWPHAYFLPDTGFPPIRLSEGTWERAALAHGALGELSAASRFLKPSMMGLKVASLQEALASSRIEGTQASLTQVLDAEIDSRVTNDDVADVLNYHTAMNAAVEEMVELPISRRLICKTHKILMSSANGLTKTPGEFRRTPVWIGSPDSTPQNAKFVPPLPSHLTELFGEWEKLVNNPPDTMLVTFLAWSHYQFETIHPFLDGNGRIGRILIELILIKYGVISAPILGISRYIERFRQEYYNVLQGVRINGDIDSLVRYFAFAIETQANETIHKIEQLMELQNEWLEAFGSHSKAMPKLIEFLTNQPIVTVESARHYLGVSQPTASSLLKASQRFGLIESRGRSGRGARESWLVPAVWKILSPHEAPQA